MLSTLAFVLAVAAYTIAAPPPPLIAFGKNGEVGVNFGGYHASAGLGGLLNGGGTGGLHAEAGTPHGQEARAGLGGSFGDSGTQGGLYAGATAGGGTRAAAGLEGRTGASGADGRAVATAQATGHSSGAATKGDAVAAGGGGLSFSASKSFSTGGNVGVSKELEVPPPEYNTVSPAVKNKKKIYETVSYQAPPAVVKSVEFHAVPPPPPTVVVKEVVQEVEAPVFVTKELHKVRTRVHKPHRHHLKSWGGAGGYFQAGIGAHADATPVATKVVHKEVAAAPAVEKRIDIVRESSESGVGVQAVQPAEVSYQKRLTFAHRNPNFFADIFNIPIQTLSAVGKLLGNAAAGTSVQVEKSAYATADAYPGESTKSVTSEGAVQIKTPSVTSIIDDVFAIPINTLGAVNQFLQNNVPAKKVVQVEGGEAVEARGRRRGRRPVILLDQPVSSAEFVPA